MAILNLVTPDCFSKPELAITYFRECPSLNESTQLSLSSNDSFKEQMSDIPSQTNFYVSAYFRFKHWNKPKTELP